MSAGALQSTGNTLDIAIPGDGLVPGRDGNVDRRRRPTRPSVQYTRAGNLTTNNPGYLTNQAGKYVLGASRPSGTDS